MYRHNDQLRARAPRSDDGHGDATRAGAESGSRALSRQASRPASLADMPFTYTSNLSEVRVKVRHCAVLAGLSEARANDLVIAVSEVAANTVRHARSPGTLDIWRAGNEIVCEIHDRGVIADPLAGQRRPAADALTGHGLWLVYQLCDLVELLSGQEGTTVRMHMSLRVTESGG